MAEMMRLVFLLLLLLPLCYSVTGKDTTTLHFSFITTRTEEHVSHTAGTIPVVDLALEQINNRTDILPNYTLSYNMSDSMCDGPTALEAFMSHFKPYNNNQPIYLALLSGSCPAATIPVAQISRYWNIPQISFTTTTDVLDPMNTSRQGRPSFFHTIPSNEHTAYAVTAVMSQFGWTRGAILTGEDAVYKKVEEQLANLTMMKNQTLEVVNKTCDDNFDLDANQSHRIFIINTSPEQAHSILCQAHKRSMLPPQYVWITLGGYHEGWWSVDNQTCSLNAIEEILNNSLSVVPEGHFISDCSHCSEKTPESSGDQDLHVRADNQEYPHLAKMTSAGLAYDTVWALAHGLDRAVDAIVKNDSSGCEDLPGNLVPLEKFNYQNEKMGCVLRKSIGNVHFPGITGPVSFNRYGNRNYDRIFLQQYRKENGGGLIRRTVGEIEIDGGFRFFLNETNLTLWHQGVPADRPPLERLLIPLVAVYYVAATLGLLYAALCFMFNMVFRKRTVVRLSSPYLNNFLILGSAILYICVYFYAFNEENEAIVERVTDILCNFRACLITVGYDLCFAVILSKTWRIYYIFKNPTPQKKTKMIKDHVLFVAVFIIVAVDLLIVLIGTSIPLAKFIPHKTLRNEEYVYICTASLVTNVWLGISLTYKLFLQIGAIFMSFHTRKVTIKALNDSKEIALLVYFTTAAILALSVITFALRELHIVYRAVFGGALFVIATIYLTVIFIPRMIGLYRDPSGEQALKSTTKKESQIYSYQLKDIEASRLRKGSVVEMNSLKRRPSEPESELSQVNTVRNHHNISAESS